MDDDPCINRTPIARGSVVFRLQLFKLFVDGQNRFVGARHQLVRPALIDGKQHGLHFTLL